MDPALVASTATVQLCDSCSLQLSEWPSRCGIIKRLTYCSDECIGVIGRKLVNCSLTHIESGR